MYDMNMNERIHLFFSKESQYLARSSGDLLEDCAIFVTALLLNRDTTAAQPFTFTSHGMSTHTSFASL